MGQEGPFFANHSGAVSCLLMGGVLKIILKQTLLEGEKQVRDRKLLGQ